MLLTHLKNSEFKKDLNNMIISEVLHYSEHDLYLAATKDSNKIHCVHAVQSKKSYISVLGECLEEVDNRLILHIVDGIKSGLKSFVVTTKDSDVVIILVSFMSQLQENNAEIKIWIRFDSENIYSINNIYEHMGRDFSLALPFFHCFSGCDSTSAFYNKSKKVMYKAWKQYPKQLELTE